MRRLPRTPVLGSVSSARNAMRKRAPPKASQATTVASASTAPAAPTEKPSRFAASGVAESIGVATAPGTCRRSVLRLAIGPSAMRQRTEALSMIASASAAAALKFKQREAPSAQSQAPRPSAG